MHNLQEYCPKCNTLKNMRITESSREMTKAHSKKKKFIAKIFHCEECQTFVHCEDIDEKMDEEDNFKIREYRDSDEQKVVNLWYECDLVVPRNNPRLDIQRKLKVNPELFLVGLIKDKIIATVMGGYEGHRGWINYLAVAKDFRKKGFGRRMMVAVEEKLKAMGCPKINLQIRATNLKVIKFYERIGYTDDNMVSMGKRFIDDSNFSLR